MATKIDLKPQAVKVPAPCKCCGKALYEHEVDYCSDECLIFMTTLWTQVPFKMEHGVC